MADSPKSRQVKLRAQSGPDGVELRVLIRHPMETGHSFDQGGPAPHFIEQVVCAVNGEPAVAMHWGPGVARNPYLNFLVAGEKGDTVRVEWRDNQGEFGSAETQVR